MKIIDGQAAFAFENNSLTLAAHNHTNISINSDHDAEKNGTLASQATALANNVFHHHGTQYNNTHFGGLAQTFLYFAGAFR
jgi:hypothetical protein